MANEEHLALLRRGVEVWNEWREKNSKISPDLREADLREADLRETDLRETDLREADLRNADLTGANLTGANLRMAHVSGANFSKAVLRKADLREAHVTDKGFIRADLIEAGFKEQYLGGTWFNRTDLTGADLTGADLRGAEFRWAALIGADLRNAYFLGVKFNEADFTGADLSNADLSETQALSTNFSNAILTGSCLKDWNINNETKLDNVRCEYVYLKRNGKERRPHNEQKKFRPGEFTKLFQKALETVELIFCNGIDWQAFLTSFQKLQVECGGEELSIQAIENKNDGAFVIRVNVPPDANKAEVENYLKLQYELELKAVEEKYRAKLEDKDKEIIEISRHHSTNLVEVVKTLAISQSITIQTIATAESNSMSETFNNDLREAKVVNFANKVQDNARQQANQYNYAPEQKQTLAEAAAEIQQLLEQLEKTNPTATQVDKQAFVTAAMAPEHRSRIVRALEAGGEKALSEFLKNPYINVAVAIIKEWQKAE